MSSSNNEITRIVINQTGFIRYVLIPFFNAMIWRSKKYYDFKDWVNVLKLIDRCHHYEEAGKELIDLILNQMNNKRLSTNEAPRVDRAFLQTKIDKLLNGPSNCEVVGEGKIWIKSLKRFRPKGGLIISMGVELQDQNGNIIKTFVSQTDCAKSLGVTRTTVARWLQENKPILFENKLVNIKKTEIQEEEE